MCDTSGSIQLSEEQKSALAFLNRGQPSSSNAGNKRWGNLHLLLSDHKQHSCQKFLLSKVLSILLLECVLNQEEKDFGGRVGGK